MPGSLSHLTRRFFDVVKARPLEQAERSRVESWLDPAQSEVFFSQSAPDQRHGLEAAVVVVEAGVNDVSVIRAALLHDVGKRQAGLGVIGRVAASLLIKLGLPLGKRGSLYRDHGPIAADELDAMGCEPLVVEFARHHHGARPAGIPEPTWDLLQRADSEPAKTGQKTAAEYPESS